MTIRGIWLPIALCLAVFPYGALCAGPAADPPAREHDDATAKAAGPLPVPNIKLAPPVAPGTGYLDYLAQSIGAAQAHDYDKAIALATRSLEVAEATGAGNDDKANAIHFLVQYQIADHRFDDARRSIERGLQIGGAASTPKDVDLALARTLGEAGRALQLDDEAKAARATPLLEEAVAINKRQLGDRSPLVASSEYDLATNYELLGKYAQAEPLYKKSLATLQSVHSSGDVAAIKRELAAMYVKQQRYADAERELTQALAIASKDPALKESVKPISEDLSRVREQAAAATKPKAPH